MHSSNRPIALPYRLISLVVCVAGIVAGIATSSDARNSGRSFSGLSGIGSGESSKSKREAGYNWNIDDTHLPLLELGGDRLPQGLEQSLSYPMDQLRFAIFQPLTLDGHGNYLLPSIPKDSKELHLIEFKHAASGNTSASAEEPNIQLSDNRSLKTFRTSDGVKYNFARYPDGAFRCVNIEQPNGVLLSLLYAARGLRLYGVVDSSDRTITFNYSSDGIRSITQTWIANSRELTRTWTIDDPAENLAAKPVKYSHAIGSAISKALPNNAVTRKYTAEMATSDEMLAHIFGGPNAVASAHGFEPTGLGAAYPLYRGDLVGEDGIARRGHLSYAMHVYGSIDGTADSPLFVPAGFTAHSIKPSPTDAVVIFYYPRLGNLYDVTLAVFHVSEFQLSYEGDRVRIGKIGGPGGSSPTYKHTHIEFYRGNTGLPCLAARPELRIDPASVFSDN